MYYAPHEDTEGLRWGVMCTCREPTQLVIAYVAHYIALGASEVRLFLDAPQPDLESLLSHIPQVVFEVRDAVYWQDVRKESRPKAVEYRQLVNAFDAFHATEVDWIGHFDADEFLHADASVADILSAQPKEVEFAVIEPRERAFVEGALQSDMFDGVFRQPTPVMWGKAPFLFGRAQRFLRQGVLGYPHGKSFLRTGGPLVPGIHTPRRPGPERKRKLIGLAVQRARLLHFDGLTALHWSGKLLRAAAAGNETLFQGATSRDSHRAKQIIRMRRMGADLPAAQALHDMLKVVPRDQVHRLIALGIVEEYPCDPARDIAALGLDHAIDLGRAGFDRALGEMMPQVGGWLAEWEDLLAADSPAQTP